MTSTGHDWIDIVICREGFGFDTNATTVGRYIDQGLAVYGPEASAQPGAALALAILKAWA